VDILQHGIDLPGGFCTVIRLAAPVADECRGLFDDDLVPDPCDKLIFSFVQCSFTCSSSSGRRRGTTFLPPEYAPGMPSPETGEKKGAPGAEMKAGRVGYARS